MLPHAVHPVRWKGSTRNRPCNYAPYAGPYAGPMPRKKVRAPSPCPLSQTKPRWSMRLDGKQVSLCSLDLDDPAVCMRMQ